MPLQLEGTISFDDIKAELGLTGQQSLNDLFVASAAPSFNQASVSTYNPSISERLVGNKTTPPLTVREFYGYGGIQILRGVYGSAINGSGFVYINAHYVFRTRSGYTLDSVTATLNGQTATDAVTNPTLPYYRDWTTYFNSPNAGEPVENQADTTSPTHTDLETIYGTVFSERDFQWTFTDGSNNYVARGFSDDDNYFRVLLSSNYGEYYGMDIDTGTNVLSLFILPNTAAGTGVSATNTLTAEVRIAAETSPGSGTFGAETVIDSINDGTDPDWQGQNPSNGLYYDSDTVGIGNVTKTNKIFIKQDNQQFPSRVTATVAPSTLYRITIEGDEGANNRSQEVFYIFY